MKNLNWVQLVLGLWVLVSPYILGFSDISTALWSNVIVGIAIVISALWQLFGVKPSAPSIPQQ
jgi:hypothetical protein